MKTHKSKFLIWFIALAVIMACAPSLAPAIPTTDPKAVGTFIVQTVNAASTQTAAAMPSSTPTETITPTPPNTNTPEPTATPTMIFILSSPTPLVIPTFTGISSGGGGSSGGSTSTKNFACQVIKVSPANGTRLSPRVDFDAVWTVKNIGQKTWDRNSVDYIFASGDKFHKVAGYDFKTNVKVGETVDLIVDMEAPKDNGSYTTNWTLRVGSENFCQMSLTIVVR
jgi:hypothetical protein